MRSFVDEQIGAKFVTSVGFDLQEIYEESNERTPLIFILSPGKLLSLLETVSNNTNNNNNNNKIYQSLVTKDHRALRAFLFVLIERK